MSNLSSPLLFLPKLESRIQQLNTEQANTKAHNVQLRSINVLLQEQVEQSKESLQATQAQLHRLQLSADQEHADRQR